MISEFDLIARFFTRPTRRATLGIGDDCALLTPSVDRQIAISCDMLVSGTHFFHDTPPHELGHKSLAVNLSDLAAMGAKPVAFTLALSLPAPDAEWLRPFSEGMFALADQYDCELIGGDTTRGPLNICVTIFGEVKTGQALRRDKAQVGDDVWVSGTLGDARLALAGMRNEIALDSVTLAAAATRLHVPSPRIALGLALSGIAHAAIDVSDGLMGDLTHILERSGFGATLDVDALPAGAMLLGQPLEIRRQFTLAGGDDYELCFTAPAALRAAILDAGNVAGTPVTRIGMIDRLQGLRLIDSRGNPYISSSASFDHFLTK